MGDFDPLRTDHHVDLLTDQPTRHRVGVFANRDRTARADRDTHEPLICIELAGRQRVELFLFLRELFGSCLIPLADHLLDESHVLITAFEVAAAAQQQRLIDHEFDVSVGRFDISIFIR